MERRIAVLGVLKFACTKQELSCIIGNLFIELFPPCDYCYQNEVAITGTVYNGERATLVVADWGFWYSGSAESIERIRKGRCLHDKPTKPNQATE